MTIPFTLKLMIVSAGALASLLAGGMVLLRSLFLFVTVRGQSMAPTLQPQDHVLARRVRLARKIKKGAIVLLDASAAQHLSPAPAAFIKRIVAVEGETYTDPDTSALLKSVEKPSPPRATRCWQIPPGMVFVCGDNLAASTDSRRWGPVPLSAIQGVVIHHFKGTKLFPEGGETCRRKESSE